MRWKHHRKPWFATLGILMVFSLLGPNLPVYAASHVHHQVNKKAQHKATKKAQPKITYTMQKMKVVVNSSLTSTMDSLSFHQQIYMPITSVISILRHLSYETQWNGSKKTLAIQNESVSSPVASGLLHTGAFATLNGHPFASLHLLLAKDLVTHRETMWVTVQDVTQLLNQLKISNSWNASHRVLTVAYAVVNYVQAVLGTAPLYANVPSTTTLTVTVLDHNGNPMANQLVTLASGDPTVASVPLQAVTSANGQAQVTVTAGTTEGTTQIMVSVGSKTTLVDVTTTLDPPTKLTASSLSPLTADGASNETLNVTVQDASGHPLPQQTVTASSSDASIANVTPSAVTGTDGKANFTITAGTKAGTATLTLQVGSITQTVNVQTNPGAPADITWQSSTTTLPADPSATGTIQAQVTDANGNPVPNVTVTFGNSNPSAATVSATAVTDQNGVASATVTPTTTQGTTQIQASVGSLTSSMLAFNVQNPTQPGNYLNLYQPNAMTSDSAYWQRESSDFYVSVQTNDPNTNNAGTGAPSLLTVEPNQTVYLFAWLNSGNLDNQTTWQVNSPDATITPSNSQWTLGNQTTEEASFTATQPGIYTVQAEDQGQYSVPLVITVGMDKLSSTPFANTGASTGIEPLPNNLPTTASQTYSNVTYTPYQPVNGWIPVSGSTTLQINHITVILQDSSGDMWNYELPVQNGQFSGLVRSPFQGSVEVVLFPNYFQTMTSTADVNQGYSYPLSYYSVNVTAIPPDSNTLALYASAHRNYNMSPNFANTADLLLENSPSIDTAIQAISNYTTESIIYNLNSNQLDPTKTYFPYYVWQDTLTAWNTHSGVCEDYSSLAAALLQSVGIPAQTVGGYAGNWTSLPASDTNPADAHQWTQAWDGNQWLVFDPTWGTDSNLSVINYIDNQYFGDTASLQVTHLPTPGQIGLWQ